MLIRSGQLTSSCRSNMLILVQCPYARCCPMQPRVNVGEARLRRRVMEVRAIFFFAEAIDSTCVTRRRGCR